MCKKLKISIPPSNQNVLLKHYKDGNFHKDYDRKHLLQSFVNFMKDPTAGKVRLG